MAGASAAATLVERTTRFTVIAALPDGKSSDALADVLIDTINDLPAMVRRSLTWDQGTEMARHAALTLANQLPVYFADPHSPWQRATNENTNGLIREYLPQSTVITDHQPYLTAIAEELNERPRAILGYRTPREAFERLLLDALPDHEVAEVGLWPTKHPRRRQEIAEQRAARAGRPAENVRPRSGHRPRVWRAVLAIRCIVVCRWLAHRHDRATRG